MLHKHHTSSVECSCRGRWHSGGLRKTIRRVEISFLLCLLVFCSIVSANPLSEETKARTSFVYINNAATTYDKEIDAKVTERIENAIAKKHNLVANVDVKTEFLKLGITDTSKAERADIVKVFKNKTDYVIVAQIDPVIIRRWEGLLNKGVSSTVNLQLKVVDVNNDKYLLNESISSKEEARQLTLGVFDFLDVGTKAVTMKSLDKILIQTEDKLMETLPKQ